MHKKTVCRLVLFVCSCSAAIATQVFQLEHHLKTHGLENKVGASRDATEATQEAVHAMGKLVEEISALQLKAARVEGKDVTRRLRRQDGTRT